MNTESSCKDKKNCLWQSYNTTGSCEEVNCWNWDSFKLGNQSKCEQNSYGITCKWSGNPTGNTTNGWCYKEVSSTSCANVTTEKACYDTFYCWWQANDWKKDEASKVTFTFAKNGKGTKLTFVHSGVPDSQVESIKKGWIDFYWTPLKAFFNKK